MNEIIDMNTGEIVEVNDAWSRHKRIVAMRNGIEQTFISLGEELYYLEKEKQYIECGHPTFESYLADPEVDITRSLAFILKGIYQTFVLDQKVQPVGLFQAGYAKLDVIRPYVNADNVKDLISMAASLSRSDLRKELSSGKEQDAQPQIDEAELLQDSFGVMPGQVWLLGEHRLVCGDCNDPAILALAIGKDKPYLMLNDPPYGIDLDTDYSKMPSTKPEGNKTYSPIEGDDKPFTYNSFGLDCNEEFWFGADYYRKSIPDGGSWLVWDKRVEDKFDAMIGSAFELIWSKVKHKREIIRCNNTLFSGSQEAKNKLHPTIKPIKVIEWIVSKYSHKGGVVLDCYAGAGTTILACENHGRKCRAIEIEPKYIAVTLRRWLDATNIEPILEDKINEWN